MRLCYWGSAPEPVEETKKEDNGENHAEIVNSVGNKIFFYSGVKTSSILELNKALMELSGKLLGEYGPDAPPIKLHINSLGGYLYDAFAGIDAIHRCIIPVHTVIEGVAASAATLMSVHGAKRYITKNSYMLIHQLSSCFWGKFEEIKDDMKNNELFMERIRTIYNERSEVPKEQIEEILKHDLWWDANTCLEYKLVDEII